MLLDLEEERLRVLQRNADVDEHEVAADVVRVRRDQAAREGPSPCTGCQPQSQAREDGAYGKIEQNLRNDERAATVGLMSHTSSGLNVLYVPCRRVKRGRNHADPRYAPWR